MCLTDKRIYIQRYNYLNGECTIFSRVRHGEKERRVPTVKPAKQPFGEETITASPFAMPVVSTINYIT